MPSLNARQFALPGVEDVPEGIDASFTPEKGFTGRLIHRSHHLFKPGDAVLPPESHGGHQTAPNLSGKKHVFATAERTDKQPDWTLGSFAYEVEPVTQDYSQDPSWDEGVRSTKGWAVKGLIDEQTHRYAREDYRNWLGANDA